MGKRNFENWLDGYEQYARDNYCPDEFHKWVGLSVIAGSLERKVWAQSGHVYFYPNIFVILVTFAGVGKSTALARGTDFLERLREEINPEFKIIPEQITEPALVDTMRLRQELVLSPTRRVFHSSGFFHASEASASALQNTHGTFTNTITAMFDCPRVFRKSVKSDPEPTEIHNVCFNMLAGATFDYLRTLVNESSVMGGFASRNIYIVNKERIVREPKWGQAQEVDAEMQDALFADLVQIHQLQGAFTPSKSFISAWEKFQPESDRALIALNSPRLESLAARKSLNTTKVAMLISAAESNNLTLESRHWDRAMELLEEASKNYPFILSQGAIADKNSQNGVTQLIGQTLKRAGGSMSLAGLRRYALANGNHVDSIQNTIDFMVLAGWIKSNGDLVELLVDPDAHL